MIVRIATEGQYRVGSAALDKLSEIDQKLMAAVEGNDKEEFSRLLSELMTIVRREGQPVPKDEIVESNIVLPPPDTSLDEAKRLFEIQRQVGD